MSLVWITLKVVYLIDFLKYYWNTFVSTYKYFELWGSKEQLNLHDIH